MPLTGVLVNPYNYSNYSNTVNVSTFPRQYGSRYSKDGSTFLGKAILSTNPNRGSTASGVINTSENRLVVYRKMLITQAQYNALNADGEYKTPDEERTTTGYVSTKYYWTQIGQTLTKDDLPTIQKEGNWRWIHNSSAMSADGNTISFGSSDNAQGYGNHNSWKMPAFNWQIAMKYNSTNDTWEKLGQIITTDSVAFNNVTGDFQCIGKDARMSHDGTRMAIGGHGDFASQNVGIIEYDATSNTWSGVIPKGTVAAGQASNGGSSSNHLKCFSGDGNVVSRRICKTYGNSYVQIMNFSTGFSSGVSGTLGGWPNDNQMGEGWTETAADNNSSGQRYSFNHCLNYDGQIVFMAFQWNTSTDSYTYVDPSHTLSLIHI